MQGAGLGDTEDVPAVAVLNPVGRGDAEPPVVVAGTDHIAGGRSVSVRQLRLPLGPSALKAVGAGAPVQLTDEVAGEGDQ